jgi:hypothetical protein
VFGVSHVNAFFYYRFQFRPLSLLENKIFLFKNDNFRFGSVFIKKIIKSKLKKKKPNQNQFKSTGFGSVGFLGQNRFKQVWLGFFV